MEAQSQQEVVSQVQEWRSVLTLVAFILANTVAIFPFHIPIAIPRKLWHLILRTSVALCIIPPPEQDDDGLSRTTGHSTGSVTGRYKVLRFHMSIIIAPVVADLFLLATLSIGREEAVRGTLGANNTDPIEVMVFFITLAYIALSIDASGLLRFLAFKVLQKGGKHGHRLYLYLYMFFFSLTAMIGNDPIILSGTPFLAYMIRISRNIKNARAWIFAQFAMANTASAILVSSNPTNLVLAGAFEIKFIIYTINMIVPVLVTCVVLFPCLLYVIFRDEELVPKVIDMHEVDEEERQRRQPINPNLALPQGQSTEDDEEAMVWEIVNPWIDKRHSIVSATIMLATLICVLILNAVISSQGGHVPAHYVTSSGASLMISYDLIIGWLGRERTRETARAARNEAERARLRAIVTSEMEQQQITPPTSARDIEKVGINNPSRSPATNASSSSRGDTPLGSGKTPAVVDDIEKTSDHEVPVHRDEKESERHTRIEARVTQELERQQEIKKRTPRNLLSVLADLKLWCHDTFPTSVSVISKLPFPLLPFAFAMFVLVEALVSKGWVDLFALGWDDWVNRTGTMGAIAGGGFLSVVLSNCTGTNIGTAILLCRIVQAWEAIHEDSGSIITDRTFWGAVYSMALGLNYGAYSSTFCASLAGLLWKDILEKKGVIVGRLEFFRVNIPIITVAMATGCAILAGEIYIIRNNQEYSH